jgi:hypothetical protein
MARFKQSRPGRPRAAAAATVGRGRNQGPTLADAAARQPKAGKPTRRKRRMRPGT